ncbi:MAG: hypothetical protein ABI155_15290 [Paralcaligenes sp.]
MREIDMLLRWHTAYEAWILEQAGIEPPTSDVQFKLKTVDIRNVA